MKKTFLFIFTEIGVKILHANLGILCKKLHKANKTVPSFVSHINILNKKLCECITNNLNYKFKNSNKKFNSISISINLIFFDVIGSS